MPFKSKAQRRFMHAKKPALAKKWSKKYGSGSKLPEKLNNAKKNKRSKGGRLK